jgi:uncharacterized repeat protein (TIGR01451 family)
VGRRLVVVLALALGAVPLLQGVASAHHAEVTASIDCDSMVSFTAEAWAGSGTPGTPQWALSRTNTDVRVWYTVDGGPQITVADGQAFNQANNFQFSGSFQAPAAGTIRVFAQAETNWANGVAGGGVWDTGALTRPTNCGAPDVKVQKSSSATDVLPGDQFTYTLTVTNVGNATATNVQLRDSIPASLTIVSMPAGCSAAGNDVTCAIGDLAAGQSASVDITVQATTGSCPKVDNFGTVSASNEPASNTGNNTSNTVSVNVNCKPDVKIEKSSSKTDVSPGEQFTYTLTATNVGNTAATDVQIVDDIPASLTIVSIPGNCSAAGNTVTCQLGTLAAGASASVTFTVEATTGSCPKVDNFGTVSASNEPVANTGNNTSNTVTVNVDCTQADVKVVKSASAATVNAGDSVTFTIEAENIGTKQATNVVITDTIPAGLTITATSAGCSVAGQTVTCNVGTLDPGQKKSITITVTATAGACPAVNNQAGVTASNEPVANTGNNLSNVVRLNVICPQPDVEIRKHSDAPGTGVFVGDTFTYTIAVENMSSSDALDVVVHDTIPAGLTIVSASSPCTVSGQNVTCNLGTVAAGAKVQVTITVRAEEGACPQVTNTATVTASNDSNPANNSSGPVTTIVNCPEGSIAVKIVKTNDANGDGKYSDFEEAKQEGMDVPFRLVITNTGEEPWTLTDLTDAFEQTVIDLLESHCAHLAGVTLDPGDSVKCTFTLRNYSPPAEETITDTAEVCVEMVADAAVTDCDDDPSRVRSAEVLGRTVTPPPTRTPPGGTAFTGPDDDAIRYGMLAIALLLLGTGAMYAGYRRRARYEDR